MTHEEALALKKSIEDDEFAIERLEYKMYLNKEILKRDCPHGGEFIVHTFRPNRDGSQFQVKYCHICQERFDRIQLK